MGLQKKIAYRLRTLREAAGLSQQDVAQRADLSLSLIAKMEQGRKADPRASTLLALAGALGVRAGQLIEELEAPPEDAFPAKGKKEKKKEKKKKKKASAPVTIGVDSGTPVVAFEPQPEPEVVHESEPATVDPPKSRRHAAKRSSPV